MEHKFIRASKYIESLRNPNKKRYARDYYQWFRSGEQGNPPEEKTLSYMAAQAVRLNLREIMG